MSCTGSTKHRTIISPLKIAHWPLKTSRRGCVDKNITYSARLGKTWKSVQRQSACRWKVCVFLCLLAQLNLLDIRIYILLLIFLARRFKFLESTCWCMGGGKWITVRITHEQQCLKWCTLVRTKFLLA